VLANFQTQRLFLLVAAVLAGACALSMGAVRSAPAAAGTASATTGAPSLQSAVAAK
jgi:hypothetical protein